MSMTAKTCWQIKRDAMGHWMLFANADLPNEASFQGSVEYVAAQFYYPGDGPREPVPPEILSAYAMLMARG